MVYDRGIHDLLANDASISNTPKLSSANSYDRGDLICRWSSGGCGAALDPSFAEQKLISIDARGFSFLFFFTPGRGRKARRFNRLMSDAGLIKGLDGSLPILFPCVAVHAATVLL